MCIDKQLKEHVQEIKQLSLLDMFAKDSNRYEKFHLELKDIFLDYSKNTFNQKTLDLLIKFAESRHLKQEITAMFEGKRINTTENRPVLHTALRNRANTPILVEGQDVMPEINAELEKMRIFTEKVRSQKWLGFTGKPIETVVNIGIGGSDLGPVMAVNALRKYQISTLDFHFVSNIDATDLLRTLERCDPETTLFIIASKTFTTTETLMNAHSARNWLVQALGEKAVKNHFVAISTNLKEVASFGIDVKNAFTFWDFVGGRYSIWSVIGLSLMLSIGYKGFVDFLTGAYDMDTHFRTAPFDKNMPALLGMISYWYATYLGAETTAILPYDQYLFFLPAYLQQLSMESNGKSVDKQGNFVPYPTGPVLFGTVGTNGQHSFYQLIHQGTHLIPCDFIACIEPLHDLKDHHKMLLANCIAQTQALMCGKTPSELRAEKTPEHLIPFKTFTGNRPSNTLLLSKLTPYSLGKLIALYEHKIFVEGILWDIDSFDQWGVELGKKLACTIYNDFLNKSQSVHYDSSTKALVDKVKGEIK